PVHRSGAPQNRTFAEYLLFAGTTPGLQSLPWDCLEDFWRSCCRRFSSLLSRLWNRSCNCVVFDSTAFGGTALHCVFDRRAFLPESRHNPLRELVVLHVPAHISTVGLHALPAPLPGKCALVRCYRFFLDSGRHRAEPGYLPCGLVTGYIRYVVVVERLEPP